MSKHTPGPWTYEPAETGLAGAITAKTGWICDFDTDPSPANARLIAAAPDLLEMLKQIFDYHTTSKPWDAKEGDMSGWIKSARAAIAKAEGKP